MNNEQIGEVREFVRRLGAADPAITHPTTTLEDLFIRIVKENTPSNGDGATPGIPAQRVS
nr:MetaGeneMark_Unknown Function [uncultured bacterium]